MAVRIATDPRSRANPEAVPNQVVFSNITSNSVTVSYTTAEAVTGFAVATGGNIAGGGLSGNDIRDDTQQNPFKTHYIVIKNLEPQIQYAIKITSDGQEFTDPTWTVKTPPANDQIGTPNPLKGKINISSPLPEALVYAMAGDATGNSFIASTLITNNSTFVIDRNSFIDTTGKAVTLQGKDVLLYINAADLGRAKMQFTATSEPQADILLQAEQLTFNAADKITPGAETPPTTPPIEPPAETPPPTETPPTEPPTTPPTTPDSDYMLDAFSEGLLVQPYSSGAELQNPIAPYNVFISNVSPTGFSVNWLTKHPTTGYVEILEGDEASPLPDTRDGANSAIPRYTHFVKANSGSVPAGTVVKFRIVSNSVNFGSNIEAVSSAMAAEFNTFTVNATSDNYAFSNTGVAIIPFQVVIPAAPTSPPLPASQDLNIVGKITAAQFKSALQAVAPKTDTDVPTNADVTRDYIAAAKTATGTLVSDVPVSGTGISLSLGSSLNQDKSSYATLVVGNDIDIIAFGPIGENVSLAGKYSEAAIPVTLNSGGSILSMPIYSYSNKGIIFGLGTPGESLTINENQASEVVTVASDGKWQSKGTGLKVGVNTVSVLNAAGQTLERVDFMLHVEELPNTALDAGTTLILTGSSLLLLGLYLYRRYS